MPRAEFKPTIRKVNTKTKKVEKMLDINKLVRLQSHHLPFNLHYISETT